MLLQRAVDASTEERRRIAATLHDGVVQELAATSFAVAGAAERAARAGRPDLAELLHGAAGDGARAASAACGRCWSTSTRRACAAAGLVAALHGPGGGAALPATST